ncbi:AI-2E family transporter [Ureibacillus acetophenoni]|uniref:Predicted PurR-regulated permease PerM n=1 Tax=Ureibacillus acetophenoni TaxID=614649 RepID=A0A285U6T6_9BACL|nr:AI-2E family transporter [Ureibacillus acetophenoni]SOC37397.1 predicted PurR-regulated permease PerM [Ureibacillus acetophenoni]
MERERENGKENGNGNKLSNTFSTKFIRFLGGKNLLFTLIALLLLGCVIFVYDKISFIFYPLQVLFEVVILPGVLAVIAYYLLRPFLRILVNWKVPKVWAILILYLIVLGLITLLVVAVYPFLRDQFKNLIEEFPIYFMAVSENIISFLNNSSFRDIFREYNFNYEKVMTDITSNVATTVQDTFTNVAKSVASGITGFVSTLTGIVLSLVTVPFILFYLLYEGEKLPKFILSILPPRARGEVSEVMKEVDKQVSSYIQGQILVSICIGVMMTIGFLIIGLDYAFVLGFLAMITSVVPYLGPAIAITPAIIIALVNSPLMLVSLVIVWTIVQLIEGKLITPNIMGKSLSIHPITIIFVLLTAGSLFGVAGVILGIPGYAILKVVVSHVYRLFKRRYNRFETDSTKKFEV